MKDLKDTRKAGMYQKDGKFYPSVTTILQVIAKPSLMFWAAEEAYWATIKNPNITVEEAKRAHLSVSNKAKDRGSSIHSAIEAYKKSGTRIVTIPENNNYLLAFYAWVDQYKPEIISQERTLFSDLFGFAGTYDLLCKVGDRIVLIDVKTNKSGRIYPESFLQVSAYKKALEEKRELVQDMAILCLAENGTFTYQTVDDAFPAFLAAKTLYEWENREKLIKLGYLK